MSNSLYFTRKLITWESDRFFEETRKIKTDIVTNHDNIISIDYLLSLPQRPLQLHNAYMYYVCFLD